MTDTSRKIEGVLEDLEQTLSPEELRELAKAILQARSEEGDEPGRPEKLSPHKKTETDIEDAKARWKSSDDQ